MFSSYDQNEKSMYNQYTINNNQNNNINEKIFEDEDEDIFEKYLKKK